MELEDVTLVGLHFFSLIVFIYLVFFDCQTRPTGGD